MASKEKKSGDKLTPRESTQSQGLGKWVMAALASDENIKADDLNKVIKKNMHHQEADTENEEKGKAETANQEQQKNAVTNWLKSNFSVPKEISSARLKICHSCEKFRQASKTCKVCNCFMPGKVHINKARCPEGRWGRALKKNKNIDPATK
jgi:hypothetical protein